MSNRYLMLMKYIQINEGVEDLQKYFPKMDLDTIKKLIALDPTYKGGDQLGKYGKWILKLAYNNVKNEISKQQYNELLKQYPDGINPKTGQRFQAPIMIPSVKDEDLYKIKPSLKQYDLYKKEIGKPLDSFKSLGELNNAISNIEQKGLPRNELALKRYNLFKKAVKKGLKIVFEDSMWIVGIPTTKESSCMFGEDTKWCTTSNGHSYYEAYTKDGYLYINLNKNDGKLYQFHFESGSYMNEADDEVVFGEIVNTDDKLKKFYLNIYKKNKDVIFENDNWIISVYKQSPYLTVYDNLNIDKGVIYKFYKETNELTVDNDLIDKDDFFNNDKELYQAYYDKVLNVEDMLSDASTMQKYIGIMYPEVKGEYIHGWLDFDEISYIYDNYRDSVSLEFIKQMLDGDGYEIFYNYGDISLNSVTDGDWNKFIKPLDISWDTIVDIIEHDGNYSDDDISESQAIQIYDYAMSDNFDFMQDGNIYNTISSCVINGSISEAYNDIIYDLKQNLPLDDTNPYSDGHFNIKLPIKEFKKTIMYNIGDGNKEQDNFWISWRELYYSEEKFSITEPYNGWYDFDRQYWNDILESFANKVKYIMNTETNDEIDKNIEEVLKASGIQINESYENILYHSTTLENAISILQNNVLYGDTHIDNNIMDNTKVGVSATRNLMFATNFASMRAEDFGNNEYVIFELDKDKLQNNYKIVPYYDSSAYDTDYSYELLEYEEVIVGNIYNILNYIKNVYVSEDSYIALNNMKQNHEDIPFLLRNAKIFNHNNIVKNKLKDNL